MAKSQVFIAYGANIGDREKTISQALHTIERDIGKILARSQHHESEPLVIPENPSLSQPSFLNGAILIESTFAPQEILEKLLAIEIALGRDRSQDAIRWGPRTIDLDIIAIDDRVVETPTLTVPHPEMQHRDFVLAPLVEIAPNWMHPLFKKDAQKLLIEWKEKKDMTGIEKPTVR